MGSQRFVTTMFADLDGDSPQKAATAKTNLRKVLLQDLADEIVTDMRTIHINETMDEWRLIKSNGSLDDEVAIVVDGGPSRPIKNVKFGGTIEIIAPASLALVREAAADAWRFMIQDANANQGPHSGNMVKKGKSGRPYRYAQSFEMWLSDKTLISGPATLDSASSAAIDMTPDDWVTIHNYAPYAAKSERYRYPQGTFVMAWKFLRKKYGSRLAIRMDYVQGVGTSQKNGSGGSMPTVQPVIRIGQPGAFPSRMPPMRRNITSYNKRKAKGQI